MATQQTARALRRTVITQEQIAAYQQAVLDVQTIKRTLKLADEDVKRTEDAYIAMLEKGFVIEAGDLRMVVDVTERSVTPKYKELFAQVAGPRAVEQAQAEAGKTQFKHIKVVSGKVEVC